MDFMGLVRLGKSIYDGLCAATNYQDELGSRRTPLISRGEAECKRAAQEHTGKLFVKARPLYNPVTGRQLELDCYCAELKLAIEYNGRQHYKYVKHFHGADKYAYKEQRYRDELKKLLCKERGITLIEVPYTVPFNDISNYIKNRL